MPTPKSPNGPNGPNGPHGPHGPGGPVAPGGPKTVTLARAPRLMPTLAKGVLTGIGKHPRASAPLTTDRLTLPVAPVDRANVASYARICGFGAIDPLPPTYPHILGFPLAARLMSARGFPLPLLGLVHTGIEITQYEPLRTEGPFELTVYAAELIPHRRGTEVAMVTEVRREGRTAWRDRSTYLARHRSHPSHHSAPSHHSHRSPTSGVSAPRPPAPTRETALPVRATWPLAADLGRRHAAVSGDYNPIHLHPLTARPLGFPRAIAHGMWTFARCVAEALPPTSDAVRVSAEFRAPVLLPATVSYAAEGPAFQLRQGERVHLDGKVERL